MPVILRQTDSNGPVVGDGEDHIEQAIEVNVMTRRFEA